MAERGAFLRFHFFQFLFGWIVDLLFKSDWLVKIVDSAWFCRNKELDYVLTMTE